jgi:hypothetical protein
MGRLIPRGAEQRVGRTKVAWHVFLTCCLFVAAPAGLLAQGTDPIKTYCVPTRDFRIPFTPANDPRIRDVLLHVSTDKGLTYQLTATEAPNKRYFSFQAQGDGWYFFIVQTRDQDGVRTPSDFRGVPPSLRVCVDTQKPVINLRQATAQDGSPAAIEWSIQDDNFDDVHADYRSVAGGEWYPMFLPRTATGVHGWTPVVQGEVEVRMQARDKAKHQAEPRSVNVKPIQPRPGAAPVAAVGPSSPSDVRHVKSKMFQLDYQLDDTTKGPSGVESVIIWKMRQGGPWQKCRETGTPEGPAKVTVDMPGRWGFRLIPRSGVGLAEPDPRFGDQPDLWIEVDEKAPQVKITNVVVAQVGNSGELTVYWSASDPFLRARPISLFYAATPEGPWTDLARDLPNHSGSYSCRPEELKLPFKFYLKVTAVDEAGNLGEDKWRDPVKVDLEVPRIKHIEVKPSEAREQSPVSPLDHPASRRQISLPGNSTEMKFSNPVLP